MILELNPLKWPVFQRKPKFATGGAVVSLNPPVMVGEHPPAFIADQVSLVASFAALQQHYAPRVAEISEVKEKAMSIVSELKGAVTYVEQLGAWLKAHCKHLPAAEVQVSSAANYIIPFVEELDDLAAPAVAPVVNPILDRIKVGLAALAITIKDSSVAGKANVQSIVGSLATNAGTLETAFQVKDPATQQRVTSVLKLISGEVGALQSQLAAPGA